MLFKKTLTAILTLATANLFAFMSSEHLAMGNKLNLRFGPKSTFSAQTKKLHLPDGAALTYGEIIALAGDYFADVGHPYNPGPGHAISTPTTEKAREAEFITAFNTLARSQHSDTLVHVTKNLTEQFQHNLLYIEASYPHSFKNAYAPMTSHWVKSYVLTSHGRNLIEPFRAANFDHFAPDAIIAYHAAHRVAIKSAIKAHNELKRGDKVGAKADLEYAYAENAFGCHYLTDAFSAGHMRTPRKALQARFGKSGVILMGYMHDLDNIQGLKVHNAKNISWTAYGDQHYFDVADITNRRMINKVLNISVDSIYYAYSHGKDGDINESKLKQYLPNYVDLANWKKFHNPAPMFYVNSKNQFEYLNEKKRYQTLSIHSEGFNLLLHKLTTQGRPM